MSFLGNCCSKVILIGGSQPPGQSHRMVVQQLISNSPSRDTNTIPLLHLPGFFQQPFWHLGWGPFSWPVFLQAHWPNAPLSHLIPRQPSFQQFSDKGISFNAGPARSLHEKMGHDSSTSRMPTFHGSFTSLALQTRDFMKQVTIWTNKFCVQLTEIFLLKRLVFTEDSLRTGFVKQKRGDKMGRNRKGPGHSQNPSETLI